MKTITIYTDGASSGNPGPGGYAAVIVQGRQRREITGGFRQTTNNRMELYAAIAGLEAMQGSQAVRLVSDSQYLVESIKQGWVQVWQAKGWRKTKKERVPNADLWRRLLALLEQHQVEFEWVEGHAGDPFNERANRLAQRSLLAANLPADEG
jgi:ribonuclease HI